MTADEQEALSTHLRRGLWIVPLSSGRIAIFDHPARSKLRAIVDSWDEVTRIVPYSVQLADIEQLILSEPGKIVPRRPFKTASQLLEEF